MPHSVRKSKKGRIKILYEERRFAVIYKEEGLLSVPFPGSTKKTALFLLEEEMKRRGDYSRYHRPFAVHRLDRDTSGVMMVALDAETQRRMMNSWQDMVKKREYVALSENPHAKKILKPRGIIEEPLAYNAHNLAFVPLKSEKTAGGNSKKTNFPPKTKKAVTHYRILVQGKEFTLFELSLESGRKNQIRAHLAYLGFKIAGDGNYKAKTNPFSRLCLHARNLEFIHPYTRELLKFEVNEPKEWHLLAETF